MVYGQVGSVHRCKAKIDHSYIAATFRVGLERQWRWKIFPIGGAASSHPLFMEGKVT